MVTMASSHDQTLARRHAVEMDLERSRKITSKDTNQELCNKVLSKNTNRKDLDSDIIESGQPLSMEDNCRADHDPTDPTIAISSTSKLAGQTVAPFLAKHIPEQYAPLGKSPQTAPTTRKDPNTKYCYRHRPDSKCRRTADEPTMENLQRVRHTGVTSTEECADTDKSFLGPRKPVAIGSTRNFSCLDAFLRCTS
jgi:hypothetical protein